MSRGKSRKYLNFCKPRSRVGGFAAAFFAGLLTISQKGRAEIVAFFANVVAAFAAVLLEDCNEGDFGAGKDADVRLRAALPAFLSARARVTLAMLRNDSSCRCCSNGLVLVVVIVYEDGEKDLKLF